MSSEGRSWLLYLHDMLQALDRIRDKTAGTNFDTFAQSQDSIEIVAWNFHVLGEASTHIPNAVVEAHPEIPWADIRTMRNRLVHGYVDLNPKILWDTALVDLPPLRELLMELALEAEGSGEEEAQSGYGDVAQPQN